MCDFFIGETGGQGAALSCSNGDVFGLGFTYEEVHARGLPCVCGALLSRSGVEVNYFVSGLGRVIITHVRARLYERLLGGAWVELDEPVRRLHERGTGPCGEGLFAVRGGNFFARWLARLSGLPACGDAVRVCLSVTQTEGGEAERWHRTFEGRVFDTLQREGEGRLLAERAGPFELLLKLSVEGGALVYTHAGASLRVGPLRVPLPRALAPRVDARESAADDGESVLVHVSSRAPLIGLMLSYEGRLRVNVEGELSAVVEEPRAQAVET